MNSSFLWTSLCWKFPWKMRNPFVCFKQMIAIRLKEVERCEGCLLWSWDKSFSENFSESEYNELWDPSAQACIKAFFCINRCTLLPAGNLKRKTPLIVPHLVFYCVLQPFPHHKTEKVLPHFGQLCFASNAVSKPCSKKSFWCFHLLTTTLWI